MNVSVDSELTILQQADLHSGVSIFWSDVGIACMAILLICSGREYGWTTVLAYYGVPYLVCADSVLNADECS